MGPEFEKGDGRLRPSLQQRLPGAEGPPEGCTTAPRHAACGGPLPSSAEGPRVVRVLRLIEDCVQDGGRRPPLLRSRADVALGRASSAVTTLPPHLANTSQTCRSWPPAPSTIAVATPSTKIFDAAQVIVIQQLVAGIISVILVDLHKT